MNYKNAIIFDDHLLFAESFSNLLKFTKEFNSVLYANNYLDFKKMVANQNVTHLFLDYLIPEINTIIEIKNIKKVNPKLNIIVVSSINNPNLILQLKKAGANGFLSKNTSLPNIKDCLLKINKGGFYVEYNINEELKNLYLTSQKELFTAREFEILAQISKGETIEETANTLNLSRHTIIAHRRNMMEKVGVNSVSALLKKAMELGMIS